MKIHKNPKTKMYDDKLQSFLQLKKKRSLVEDFAFLSLIHLTLSYWEMSLADNLENSGGSNLHFNNLEKRK